MRRHISLEVTDLARTPSPGHTQDRPHRSLDRRASLRSGELPCLYRLVIRYGADDAEAVLSRVRKALGEYHIAQWRNPRSAESRRVLAMEVIVRSDFASRRDLMARMSRLEHDALVRGVGELARPGFRRSFGRACLTNCST